MVLRQILDLHRDRLPDVLHAHVPLVRELLEFFAIVLFDLLALILMLRHQISLDGLLSVLAYLIDVIQLSLRLIIRIVVGVRVAQIV